MPSGLGQEPWLQTRRISGRDRRVSPTGGAKRREEMPFADAPRTDYHRPSTAVKGVLALAAARDYQVRCGAVKGRSLRLVVVGLLLAGAMALSASAALAGGQPQGKHQPGLKPLWSAFPLDQNQKSAKPQAAEANRAHAQSPSTDDDGGTLALLAGAIFVAMLAIGGIALVAVRLPRPALALPGGRHLPNAGFRLRFRPPKGGLFMSKARRRLWARGGSNTPTGRPEERAGGNPHRIVDRLAEYTPRETQPSTPAPDDEAREEPVAAQAAADVPADLSALGHQVWAGLGAAQEGAAPPPPTTPAG